MYNTLLIICGVVFIAGQLAAMVLDAPDFPTMGLFCAKMGPIIGRGIYMLPTITGIIFIAVPTLKWVLK
jgi:hypothetical protein